MVKWWIASLIPLRKLTGKKHPQIKFQRFWKVWTWTFGWLVHQIISLYEVLKLKQNFRKTKVVTGETPLFVIGPSCSPILIVLTLASDREEAFLYFINFLYFYIPLSFRKRNIRKIGTLFGTLWHQVEKLTRHLARSHAKFIARWHTGTETRWYKNHASKQACCT